MEHETLFTASKWHILKQLEKQPRSPLELAKLCNTSVANVSQQLRLLEMAGVVTSKRIPNRDKDKPRILYSIAGNLSYLITTSEDFVDKKLLNLTDYNRIIMRIWFYEKPELHYTIEKAFWKIEEHLDKIAFLAIDNTKTTPIVFYYNPVGKLELKPFTVADRTGATRQVIFENKRIAAEKMHVLYDRKQEKKRGGVQ